MRNDEDFSGLNWQGVLMGVLVLVAVIGVVVAGIVWVLQ